MEIKNLMKYPIQGYSTLRSLSFFLQFQALSRLTLALPFMKGDPRPLDKKSLDLLLQEVKSLVQKESENIALGVYPISVLKPESPLKHALRVPRIFWDGLQLNLRKNKKETKKFSTQAREELSDLPDYYSRNFHFQTDGYLSQNSAELYEHQVDLLFAGMADSMRRLFLPELKELLQNNDQLSRPLQILELACGTGRGARFVKLTFPHSHLIATDISAPYLKMAQTKLSDLNKIDFLKCDATNLPFKDQSQDLVFCIFLFHELPLEERLKVIAEAHRVLKPGGYFAALDSLQLNDRPDFNTFLENFPVDFHEPFYTNYIKTPMQELFAQAGLQVEKQGQAFLSKYWITKRIS